MDCCWHQYQIMNPIKIPDEDTYNHTVYYTDDYRPNEYHTYGRVRRELHLLPYDPDFIGYHLRRPVQQTPTLQTLAARVVIKEIQPPLQREKLLKQIPQQIRILINQVHVDMIDYWYHWAFGTRGPREYEYGIRVADNTFFQVSDKRDKLIIKPSQQKRVCCRLNHQCAYMKNVRRRAAKRLPILYCPINGRCMCTCRDAYNRVYVPPTCTVTDMRHIYWANSLLPATLRRHDLEDKMDVLGFQRSSAHGFKLKK